MDPNTGTNMEMAMATYREAMASPIIGEFTEKSTTWLTSKGFRATVKTNEPGTANQDPAHVKLHSNAQHAHHHGHHHQEQHHHGHHHQGHAQVYHHQQHPHHGHHHG
ncbi:hypothetical protein CEXT_229931 [Caerostris extrusa]|uniref:Uncharacterized protein n=1 Tax=Caerostris extrusa TaxID=172846 RepID=A0AAV4MNU9_CAEEX|nr:hypothetical protein CEXT_229931 [Caerostris extrusa]